MADNKKKSVSKVRSEKFTYYPDVTDPDFYQKITKKKEFYIHKQKGFTEEQKKDITKACYRDRSVCELLPHQKLLKNLMSPDSPYRNLLIMHGTGSGKTLTAIQIAEHFKGYLRRINERLESKEGSIYIIASDEAQDNFKKELLGRCMGEEYITDKQRYELDKLRKETSSEAEELYHKKLRDYYKKLTTKSKDGIS